MLLARWQKTKIGITLVYDAEALVNLVRDNNEGIVLVVKGKRINS